MTLVFLLVVRSASVFFSLVFLPIASSTLLKTKALCGLFRIRPQPAPLSSRDRRRVQKCSFCWPALLWSKKKFCLQGDEINDIVKEMEALPKTSKLRQVFPALHLHALALKPP
jgi:hypothetical protein